MKTLKTLTIVVVTGLVGLTAVQACPSGAYKGSGEKSCKSYKQKKSQMKGMFKQLDLTAEQKEQMQALRKEMQVQRKANRKANREGKQCNGKRKGQMGQFVSAEGFDKEGFVAYATQKSQVKINMRAEMFEKRMNILTPEQRTKFSELLQEK